MCREAVRSSEVTTQCKAHVFVALQVLAFARGLSILIGLYCLATPHLSLESECSAVSERNLAVEWSIRNGK